MGSTWKKILIGGNQNFFDGFVRMYIMLFCVYIWEGIVGIEDMELGCLYLLVGQ